jgi:very-short-patch-repair endonuclease
VSRKQIAALRSAGVIDRVLRDTYRMTAVVATNEQRLRAALLWAGDTAAAAVLSAGEFYGLEGVTAPAPEIVVPRSCRVRDASVVVHRTDHQLELMVRTWNGLRVTGVEASLVALAAVLDGEAFEIAFEDARRRRLTSMPALRSYAARFRFPHPGMAKFCKLIDQLDPARPSRSALEVKARRLLVANGLGDFVRELPLTWRGRTYYFDFAYESGRTILEINGRRWHDDPADYEHDNEKWSVPARHGYRLLFATWEKVTRHPTELVSELRAALSQ